MLLARYRTARRLRHGLRRISPRPQPLLSATFGGGVSHGGNDTHHRRRRLHRAASDRISARRGGELYGLSRSPTVDLNLDRYYSCDVTDAQAVREVVDEVRPTRVYHLVACPTTATSPEIQATIVDGFRNLTAALERTNSTTGRPTRMLVIGSAGELGQTGTRSLPAAEDAPCGPLADYGRAKLAVTRMSCERGSLGGVEILVARAFNLVGPGMGEMLSLGRFARQIASYRKGDADRIHCGNLSHRRDYVDVRDAVAGYAAVLERGRPGEIYNICSGRSWQMSDLLRWMLRLADVDAPVESVDRSHPGDVVDVYGDPSKTAAECGWKASTPIERSLMDLLSAMPVSV
ncbi:MAG: GDP-mannose 4,6-dehydratase [Pirellulales bacterium]